jgi:hypothetical protein
MGIGSLAGDNGLNGSAALGPFGGTEGLKQTVNGIIQRVQQLAQRVRTQASDTASNTPSDPSQQLAGSLSQLRGILQRITTATAGAGQENGGGQGGARNDLQNIAQQVIDALRQQGVQTPRSTTGFPKDDVFQPSPAAHSPLQQARMRELSQALHLDPKAVRSALQNGASVPHLATQQGISMKDLQVRLESQLKANYPGASSALRARIAQRMVNGPRNAENGTGLPKNYPSYPARLVQQGTYAA